MKQRELLQLGQDKAVEIFHRIAALPGYEPIDEDTAIALVSAYGKEFAQYEATRVRIREIVEVLKKVEVADRDYMLEVLTAPMITGQYGSLASQAKES